MPTFKVGQKVTCINGNFSTTYNEIVPRVGVTYTVRSIASPGCIRLQEIVNAPHEYKTGVMECSFRADRFKAKRGK